MTIKDYQELSQRTLNKKLDHNELLANMALGISGESGEVADIIKKYLYQGHAFNLAETINELGDIMFYIANLCNVLKIDLEDVMHNNLMKLRHRYPEGFDTERSINRS